MHDVPDPARVANVRERIGVQKNEIGPLSDFDRAEFLIGAKYASSATSAGMNRLQRSKSRRNQLLQFHVYANRNLPDVSTSADRHSRT